MTSAVSRLFVYPVKSLAAVEVTRSEALLEGLRHDRRWMIVDEEGTFVSQREAPALTRVTAHVEADVLTLTRGTDTLHVDARALEATRTVRVWDDTFVALEAGRDAADFVSSVLGRRASLVKMADGAVEGSTRTVDVRYAGVGHTTGFADGFPYLIVSDASVRALESKLGHAVDVRRFRPNVVVTSDSAFVEDTFSAMHVGARANDEPGREALTFRLVKPCARCVMVNVDPDTATSDKETLKTLSTFRKFGNGVLFAMNAVIESEGTIAVGDAVTFSEPKTPPG